MQCNNFNACAIHIVYIIVMERYIFILIVNAEQTWDLVSNLGPPNFRSINLGLGSV